MKRKNVSGQTLVEYSIIIGIVVTVFVAMNPMIKRGFQSMIKIAADQIGNQENSDQTFDESGYMEYSNTEIRLTSDKETVERLGIINYMFNDSTFISTETSLNLGITGQ